MTRTVTALFDSRAAAERAAHDLATRIGGVRGEIYDADRAGEIRGLGIPEDDSALMHENIRRGGAVLHARVPDDRFDAVADALEAAGARDFDETEATFRREGWAGHSAATGTAAAMPVAGDTGRAAVVSPQASATAAGAGMQAAAASGTGRAGLTTGGEEHIPIVEERLRVGKREAAHGRVRIRSYVVETPVEEQVRLREEHVQVERRPVDRPVTAADADLFRERTIEATETSEEAVVEKTARVTEELVVRKEAEERTETVRDTVRRTEVEVEDDRTASATRGTTATPGGTTTPKGPDRV